VAQITWLASYPKSGNTWLRAFLANYLSDGAQAIEINKLPYFSHGEMAGGLFQQIAQKPLSALSEQQVQELRPSVHRALAALDRDPNLVKTHNALVNLFNIPIVTPQVTRNAIYVIRNPLDVVISYADHHGLTIDRAIEQMAREDNRTPTTEKLVFQFLGRWCDHAQSWLRAPGLALHVVRYEDLLARPQVTFGAIGKFLGIAPKHSRLARAIRRSSFRVLKTQEASAGFHERSRHSEAFFRSGEAGQWRRTLNAAQIDRIVSTHGEVMARHGYLP